MFDDSSLSALLNVVGVVTVGFLAFLGALDSQLPAGLPADRVGWGLMALTFGPILLDRLRAGRRGQAVG